MDPGLLRDALTVLAGVATGTMSGLFGVGGAVISTPAIRALGASAAVAVGTTLPSIIPGAASGTARYLREGLIDVQTVRWTAPAGIVAAIVGSWLSKRVPGNGHVLMLMTAALLGFSAWRMYATRQREPDPSAESDAEVSDLALPGGQGGGPSALRFGAIGAVAGMLSGLLGVGGGIVMVPGFTQFAKVPLKQAIATSLACVAIFAVPGTITHAIQGDIDWRFALLLAVGVIPGARLGSALTVKADSDRLRLVVAAFLGFTAILYGAGELAALV
jgi:uncharacterized protein